MGFPIKFFWFFFLFILYSNLLFGYKLVIDKSTLSFKAYQFKRLPTNGSFHVFNATLNWPDSILVNFEMKSVDTNNKTRDRHLRSPDFLSVNTFPRATFVSKTIKKETTSKNSYIVLLYMAPLSNQGGFCIYA